MNGLGKLVLIYILRLLVHLLYIFPIKYNRVIFSAYRGQQYSCNPKYISQKLQKLYGHDIEIIWAFNEPEKYAYLKKDGICLVKYKSIKRFFYEATAKVSINNIGSFSYLPLRKGQEHINTWHSGLDLETCGINEPNNNVLEKYCIGLSAKETTLFLSANKVFSDYSVKVQFGYIGTLLNCGLPRSDNLINGHAEDIRIKVREEFKIACDTVIIMYAPTWRYGGISEMPKIDYVALSRAMKKRFGNNYIIWNRSHHLVGETNSVGDEHLVDVTKYADIEELVIASDIMISDYSSVIWDGALQSNMIIQYVPDAQKFEKERGLYVPVGNWCIPVAFSMDELCAIVENADLQHGKACADKLLKMMGSYETGKASEICSQFIAKTCGINITNNIYTNYMEKCDSIPDNCLIYEMREKGKVE